MSPNEKRIRNARINLLTGRVPGVNAAAATFFSLLSLRLELAEDASIPWMATDGKWLLYGPRVGEFTHPELVGVVAHEVLHCGLKHFARRNGRNPRRWNRAGDLAINWILREAGFRLPAGALIPGEGQYAHLPVGLSAEQYYDLLGDEEGDDESRTFGEVIDGDGDSSTDWDIAVAQAAAAAGTLPGALGRAVSRAIEPQIRWQDALRDWVDRYSNRDDYSWSHPSRRSTTQYILPGLRSEGLGRILIMIDTSGSISDQEYAIFAAETEAVLGLAPCEVEVCFCDCAIHDTRHWTPSDGPLDFSTTGGGGGTSHVPAFEWAAQFSDAVGIIAFTDLQTVFPKSPPDIPVLWVTPRTDTVTAPFGTVLVAHSQA